MKGKFIGNISANTLQLVCNQLFGLAIFYVLSNGLDKAAFGQLNLALAILLTSFQILSFGIDQVVVRKIASGTDPVMLLTTYIAHVLVTGTLFYALLLAIILFLPDTTATWQLLLLIGAGKLMIFFSTPFKQLATGLERFNVLAWMCICSNIIRGCGLILLSLTGHVSIDKVIALFIAGDLTELLLCIYLGSKFLNAPIIIRWNQKTHLQLIREALPQAGVQLFSSALSRLDWIFIGIMASAVNLAEYSFAYKAFELSTLPLLVVAPLLLPKFTRHFQINRQQYHSDDLHILLRAEMIVASAAALILNILWAPVIDAVTNGRYGAVNTLTVFILTLSMPLLYFNNFMWSINFAQGRFKMIFRIILMTFIMNTAGAILLIPPLKNEGAATAYFLAILTQSVLYIKATELPGLSGRYFQPVWICPLCALMCGIICTNLFANTWILLAASMLFFLLFLFVTRQLRPHDWHVIKKAIN